MIFLADLVFVHKLNSIKEQTWSASSYMKWDYLKYNINNEILFSNQNKVSNLLFT